MRWRVELSDDAQTQLSRLPSDARGRIGRAIDEFEQREESAWTNVKALQGPAWKGRFRKRVGPYRIIFRKSRDLAVVEISAILIRSKDTYR